MPNLAVFRNTSFKPFTDITLAAGEQRELSVWGQSLRVTKSSRSGLEILLNDRDFVPLGVGLSITTEAGEIFDAITLRNPTADPITFSFIVYRGRVDDDRLNLIREEDAIMTEDATTRVESDVGNLAGSSSNQYDGAYLSTDIKRRAFYVSNKDLANNLFVGTSSGEEGIIVGPEESIVLETSDTLFLVNGTGSPIAYSVIETIYIETN